MNVSKRLTDEPPPRWDIAQTNPSDALRAWVEASDREEVHRPAPVPRNRRAMQGASEPYDLD